MLTGIKMFTSVRLLVSALATAVAKPTYILLPGVAKDKELFLKIKSRILLSRYVVAAFDVAIFLLLMYEVYWEDPVCMRHRFPSPPQGLSVLIGSLGSALHTWI